MTPKIYSTYLMVVLIWSTTPLTIVWSSESVHPTMAVLLRMLIAAILGLAIIWIKQIRFPWDKTARKLYAYSGLGIFIGMSMTYLAARYIPSGIISLIFGLAPLISALLGKKILNEPAFTQLKKIALLISLLGLAIVCSDNLALKQNSWLGLIYIFLAVFFFSLSSVLVKSVDIKINPLSTTVGALLLTLPCFSILWYLLDGTLTIEQWQPRSVISILYLGVFGSLIGFVGYYYILQKLSASTVALVTLMTPVIAMVIGAVFNHEIMTNKLFLGATFVMSGLGLFLYGDRISRYLLKFR